MGRYKSYLTGVQNEGGGSRPILDNVQKKDAFLWFPLGPQFLVTLFLGPVFNTPEYMFGMCGE